MTSDQQWRFRLATLSTLVKKAPQAPGRTAMMKFAYLLQTVRGLPLGYYFQLYNYGPYDNTVLGDLSQANTFKAIKTDLVHYPRGDGYAYRPNKGHDALCKPVADELRQYEDDIAWVLDKFGRETASRLELISTIVFGGREMESKRRSVNRAELCRLVREIKPHFSEGEIDQTIGELAADGLISVPPV